MGSTRTRHSGLPIEAIIACFWGMPHAIGGPDGDLVDHLNDASLANGLYYGDPLPGVSPELVGDYTEGLLLFSRFWSVAEGLGPRFNERSCTTCYAVPMTGGSGVSPLTFVQHDPAETDPTGGTTVQKYTATADQRMIVELLGREPACARHHLCSVWGSWRPCRSTSSPIMLTPVTAMASLAGWAATTMVRW